MKRFLFVSLALVSMMATAPSAHAAVLSPGGSSTTFDPVVVPAGSTLEDTVTGTLTSPDLSGTYTQWVYKTPSGTYDFLYQVATTSGVIHRVTTSHFGTFTTDVGVLTGLVSPPGALPGGIVPNNVGGTVVDRSSEGGGVGNVVGFNFTTVQITAGSNSVVLAVETNATSFSTGGFVSIIDGTTAFNNADQPAATIQSVPEPSTMALAGLGALGLIGYSLRRRKALGA
jgi:hypothetical protein